VLFIMGCNPFDMVRTGADPDRKSGSQDGEIVDAGSSLDEQYSFLPSPTRTRVVQGTTTTVPISIVRKGASKGDISITLTGAPPGVAAAPLTIPSASTTGQLEIVVATTVSQGPMDVTIEGNAVNGKTSASESLPLFVRGPSGSLDTTFAVDGRLNAVFGEPAVPLDVFVQADDTILVLGACSHQGTPKFDTCIARLTSEGALDTTYGTGGIAILAGLYPSVGALLPDGGIVVGGRADGAAYGVIPTNGRNVGVVTPLGATVLTPPAGLVGAIARAPDNHVVMVFDVTTTDAIRVMGIAKVTNAGALDAAFGTGGIETASFMGNDFSSGTVIAVRPNGKIVIVGEWSNAGNSGYGILQLDGSGTNDASFGMDDGQTLIRADGLTRPGKLLLVPNGQVISTLDDGYGDYSVIAFTSGGNVDNTFGMGGMLPVSDDLGPQVFLDDQDRLLVTTGTLGALESVRRYTAAGITDTSFGRKGKVALPLPAESLSVSSLADVASVAARVQTDGRIVLLSGAIGSGAINANLALVSRLWN